MKPVRLFLLPLAAVGLLLFPTLVPAASYEPIDSAGVQAQPQQQNGITYLSGGIGLDESRTIEQAQGYNLHMTFAVGPQNQYTADVDVVVQKAPGQALLTLDNAGPLVYMKLPAGKYSVIATRHGEERRDTADVGSGGASNLVFHWNDAQ